MKNNSKTLLVSTLFFTIVVMMYSSCSKNSEPENPYDAVNYNVNPPPADTNDVASIQSLHKTIFAVKCGVPGCHDGHFEPDFRTVQSTYSTLVFQKPIKNNITNDFKFRVKPYDTTYSWLHERLTTEDLVLGRMPLYSSPLNATEMSHINNWIMHGAKDMFGIAAVQPSLPNSPPKVLGYGAFVGNTQIDTNRFGGLYYNPFIINAATNMVVAFLITDDSTDVINLTINKLKISTQKNDFTNAAVYNATYLNIPGQGQIWYAQVSAAALPQGVQLYMRYYVGDGVAGNDIEYPNNALNDFYKTYYSFIIQ